MTPTLKGITIPPELADAVMYTRKGELLMCDVTARDNKVVSFLSRLRRLNLGDYPSKVVDLKDFLLLRQQNGLNKQDGGVPGTPQTPSPGSHGDVPLDMIRTDMLRKAKALFAEGQKNQASDVHIRVYNDKWTQILFRIHGSMTHIRRIPYEEGRALCQAIYQSMADVSDSTYREGTPQDARIARDTDLPEGLTGIRIACGPHAQGLFMVLRLLYESLDGVDGSMYERLANLGYTQQHIDSIELMRRRPAGLNIIAGPTGSGKSTTLKHLMESISLEQPDLCSLSVEDPPEYNMGGVIQIPVTNAKTPEERAEAFNAAIRLALRSDPDIIMIGEVRDAESARLAVRASMTGHQVWTTLHANSAFNILTRMYDIMVSPEMVNPLNTLADTSVLTGMVFQRLIKTLCPACKIPFSMGKGRLREDVFGRMVKVLDVEDFKHVFLKGDGCPKCRHGVYGRTVVAEVVCPDPHMIEILRTEGVIRSRDYWVKELKGKTVIHHAISKIKAGIVDPELAEAAVGPLTMDLVFEDGKLEESEYGSLVRTNQK